MKKGNQSKIKYIVLTAFIIVFIIFTVIEGNLLEKVREISISNTIKKSIDNATENPGEELYEVIKVVDGDTIQIMFNGKKERLRLIGIDTPESVHSDESKNTEEGRIASEYVKTFLEGKYVTLEFDVEERDQYDRLLAYVYLDGEMVNKKIIRDGYASLETVPPNVKYVDEFTTLLKEAKDAKRGLWANQ